MGYIEACKVIISILFDIYGKEEVDAVISVERILCTAESDPASIKVWDRMFDAIYTKRGTQWLAVAEGPVRSLVATHGIEWPKIFKAELNENIRRVKELEVENTKLSDTLADIRAALSRCKLTGLFNEKYFIEYSERELAPHMNIAFMAINIDNLASINYKYGAVAGDESFKITAHILSGCCNPDMLFRLSSCHFGYLVEAGQDAVDIAEEMRRRIEVSQAYVEKTTVSIGVAFLNADVSLKKDENVGLALYKAATVRMHAAKQKGMNSITSSGSFMYSESKSKVLVVDPDKVVVEILKASLTRVGFEVLTAYDGLEALRIVSNTDVSLVLAESILPKLDGVVLKSKINEDSTKKDIPFMLMSFKKEEQDVSDAFAVGACQYFKKPVLLSEVVGVVVHTLKKR